MKKGRETGASHYSTIAGAIQSGASTLGRLPSFLEDVSVLRVRAKEYLGGPPTCNSVCLSGYSHQGDEPFLIIVNNEEKSFAAIIVYCSFANNKIFPYTTSI
jgi:hypothetical protein